MKHMILALALVLAPGCSWLKSSGVLQPLTDAGCAVEKTFASAAGVGVAGITGATDPVACGSDLQVSLGNANLCSVPVVSTSGLKALATAAYTKLGDISQADIDSAKAKKVGLSAEAVKAMGIIGSIACPLGDSIVIGFLSGGIPKSCQGPNPLSATAANAALVAACEAALGTLP